jgi:hypothetical protein
MQYEEAVTSFEVLLLRLIGQNEETCQNSWVKCKEVKLSLCLIN